jgi:hypothetical protein
MCSATDSFEIALAAEGVDICEPMCLMGDSEPGYQVKLILIKHSLLDFTFGTQPASCI